MFKRLAALLALALVLFACGPGPAANPAEPPAVVATGTAAVPATAAPAEAVPTQAAPTEAAPGEPAPTEAASTVRVVARAADNSLQIADTGVPIDVNALPAAAGLLPQGGLVAGTTVYALDFSQTPQAVALDVAAPSAMRPLDFVVYPSYGLAVWPGDAGSGPLLGWGTQISSEALQSQIVVAAPDGSQLQTLVTEDIPELGPYLLVAQRWSADGQSLYFSREPSGIGGYILFAGASSLYRVSLADQSVTEVIPYDINTNPVICLDAFSPDERLVAEHCDGEGIHVRNLETGEVSTIAPPAEVTEFGGLGSARFSPDGSRVAFALARNDPASEQGWVAVSDGLSGNSTLIVTGQTGQSYNVAAWLNASTLLLESNDLACDPSCLSELWAVSLDGSNLAKVADGTFLSLVDGYRP